MRRCLLCGCPTTEPFDLSPQKAWWPLMVRCLSDECRASPVAVAADPAALERSCYETEDSLEPKFAYTKGGTWFVSTIYRRSTAMLMPGWYYETHAYLDPVDPYVVALIASGVPREQAAEEVAEKRRQGLIAFPAPRPELVTEHGDHTARGALRAHAVIQSRLRRTLL